jgi:hypothetical protein
MAYLPDQCCWRCRERALPGKDHCAAHPPKAETAKETDRNRNRAPDRKFYDTAAWAHTSENIRVFNPICAKVDENGKQCARKSKLVHHIIDPRDAPTRKLDWSNLVALCEECHSGGERGSTKSERYVHTLGALGMVYKHAGHDGGFPQWKVLPKDYVATAPAENAVCLLPCDGRVSSVGDDALDAALATED